MAVDAAIVATLALVGMTYARLAFDRALERPDYFYLSPAVGIATGHGFLDPVAEPGSPLHLFLSGQSASLALDDLKVREWREPDQSQHASRYLLYAVGLAWRWLDVSWASLGWVAGALHSLLVVGAYALFRWAMPVPLAASGAVWLAVSALTLRLVPHVRDYSKGAFIVALLPCIVAVVVTQGRTALMVLSLATGLVAGIGAGFKMDVSIAVPIAAIAIIGFRERLPWNGLPVKLLAVGALVIGYLVASAPVFFQMSSGGSNAFHVLLLGWATPLDVALGVQRSLYTVLPFYSDRYVSSLIQSHALATTGIMPAFTSPAYDAASTRLFMDIAVNLPGDVATRILASANTVLNLLFRNPDQSFVSAPLPGAGWMSAVSSAFARLDGAGAGAALIFVACLAFRSVRHALLASFLILAAGGYAFLQFGDRHYFHLQVLSVGVVLGSISGTATVARELRQSGRTALAGATGRVAVALVTILLTIIGPTLVLRAVQARTLERHFSRLFHQSPVPMPVAVTDRPDGTALVQWPEPAGDGSGALRPSYYLAEFNLDAPLELIMGVRYTATGADTNFSRTLALNATPGANFIGFQAFTDPGRSAFDGLELGPQGRRHLTAVYRLEGGPAGLPIDVMLPSDWRRHPLHYRFQAGSTLAGPNVSCGDRPACTGVLGDLERRPGRKWVAATLDTVHASIVRPGEEGVTVRGLVEDQSMYLFEMKSVPAAVGAAFLARGTLYDGSIAIGLLKQGRWYKQAVVSEPGDFAVALAIDEAGEFKPLVTAAMAPGRRREHVLIAEAGFVSIER
jgi:hypothetical protein